MHAEALQMRRQVSLTSSLRPSPSPSLRPDLSLSPSLSLSLSPSLSPSPSLSLSPSPSLSLRLRLRLHLRHRFRLRLHIPPHGWHTSPASLQLTTCAPPTIQPDRADHPARAPLGPSLRHWHKHTLEYF